MDEKDFVERIAQEREQSDRAWVDEQSWLVRLKNNGRATSSANIPEYIQPHGGGIAGFMSGYPIAGSFFALLLGGMTFVIFWWLRM